MKPNQVRRKVRKMVINNYANILKNGRKIASAYAVERVPIKLLFQVINEAKLKNKFEVPQMELFRVKFNASLEQLKDTCKASSEVIGDDKVSIGELKTYIEVLRAGFIRGQSDEV